MRCSELYSEFLKSNKVPKEVCTGLGENEKCEKVEMKYVEALVPTQCSSRFLREVNALGKQIASAKTEKAVAETYLFSTAIWYACTPDAPLDPLMHSALVYFAEKYNKPELCVKALEADRRVEDARVALSGEPVQTYPFFYGPEKDPIKLEPKFEWFDGAKKKTAFWLTYAKFRCRHPAFRVPAFLRDYQRGPYLATISTLYCRLGAILKAPTGFGKTVVASAIINELLERKMVERVTVLVPLKVLVEQWEESLIKFCPLCDPDDNVRVATYQQVYYWLKEMKDKYPVRRQATSFLIADPLENPKEDKGAIGGDADIVEHYVKSNLVVFDEVHSVRAKTFGYVLDANKRALRLGLSATPEWLEKDYHIFPLTLLIGPIIEGPKPSDLIKMGRLSKFTVERIEVGPFGCSGESPTRCLNAKADEVATEVARALLETKPWKATDKVLILVPTVKLGRKLSKALGGGIPIYYSKKKSQLEEFKEADYGVAIATSQLLQVGYDDPKLTVLVLADPVARPERLKQILGRLLRKKDENTVKKVVDVCIKDYVRGCEKRMKVYEELQS